MYSPISHQRVVDDISQDVPPLSPFFEKIIDKKVNRVALNIFERFVDFLCSCFYRSYNQRLAYHLRKIDADKNVDIDLDEEPSPIKGVTQKVHHFMDGGAPLNVDIDLDEVPSPIKGVTQKVHHFADGAPLYDRTSNQRVAIHCVKFFDCLTQQTRFGPDFIFIDDKPVYFDNDLKLIRAFGKKYNTREIV